MQEYFTKPLLQQLSTHLADQKIIHTNEFHEDIRKNLESLLNTRLRYINIPVEFKEICNSLLNYGINDFMHFNYAKEALHKELCVEIETTIRLFEPRISEVCVLIQNETADQSSVLKLKIEATLKNFRGSKLAIFESSMDLNKHAFTFI